MVYRKKVGGIASVKNQDQKRCAFKKGGPTNHV